jgi:hypothetical protein
MAFIVMWMLVAAERDKEKQLGSYCAKRYRKYDYFLPFLEHLPVAVLQIEPRMLLAQCAFV